MEKYNELFSNYLELEEENKYLKEKLKEETNKKIESNSEIIAFVNYVKSLENRIADLENARSNYYHEPVFK
jgi:cell division septum initiation protein DivIVA